VEGREDEVVASMLFFLVFLDVWWNFILFFCFFEKVLLSMEYVLYPI